MAERPTRVWLASGAAVVALALSACGGGDDGGGESDEDAVRAAFDGHAAAISEGDVEAYCDSFSAAELERTGVEIEGCKSLDPGSIEIDDAADARITSLTIEGDEATVEYELGDGTAKTGTIVQEDGEWKITELTFF